MVTVYKTNNKASKDAIHYLEKHHIEHEVVNYKQSLSDVFVKTIFTKSIDGIDPLLAKKSSSYQTISALIDEMKLSDLISLVLKNPMILKTPIMFDDRNLVVGFSKDTIRVFFPRS